MGRDRQLAPELSAAPRPLRADAVRNRELLLGVAREAFAADGVDVSLEEIARRAGVGIGTLYRRFPTREDLIESVLSGEYARLEELARMLADQFPPREALGEWLGEMMRYMTMYRGLSACMKDTIHDRSTRLGQTCMRMMAAAENLLIRAQAARTVRDDVTFQELAVMTSGISWAAERAAEKSHGAPTIDAAVLMDIMLKGLEPRARVDDRPSDRGPTA